MPATRAVDPSISKTPLPLDAENLATVCVLCSHNCGLRVDVADGKITEIRADESSPITHGYICNKGFAIKHYVEHAQRVEHPLKRRSDGSSARSKHRRSASVRQIVMIGVCAAWIRFSRLSFPSATALRANWRRAMRSRAIASRRSTRRYCAAR